MNNNALYVAKRLADAYNRKDWKAFADLLDPNAIYELPNADSGGVDRRVGVDAVLEYMKDWSEVIPDDTATFGDSRLTGDDTVVCEVVWSGTRSGAPFELRGITVPANGGSFTNRGSTRWKDYSNNRSI